ncbi:hypothetical protein TSUD_319650 [Trifolium subterraneum]|uniref:peroxidase n=1 Tax=Trifolium subterraneum TaxID=3900 RepID=A0A2Z6NEE0_TRISU|nr:hypothetical protein TSUD_319650 [Trifolium subterraneum]
MYPKKLNYAIIVLVIYFLNVSAHSQLEEGFYSYSCNMAEFIVKDEVRKSYNKNPGIAAGLVRMHFHDCFIRAGGLGYDVPAGRRDGKISLVSDTRTELPPPTFNVNQLTQLFARKGRLYNFSTTSSQDPSLHPSYAAILKRQCPQGNTNPNLVVPMDPSSPGTADVGYYLDILANRGLFTSDQTLLTNTNTARQVNQNARNPYLWSNKFADAMVKMGQIGVLTGNAGEIRTSCRVVNS